MRDRRAERREATTSEILEAAWEIVRAEGLAGLTLRRVAHRVGMQAPSLYSYFESKHAIYDSMYAQGCHEYVRGEADIVYTGDLLQDLRLIMGYFVEFCTADPVRYQLLFQRTIPGFEPSPESFAISVGSIEGIGKRLAPMGLTDPEMLDLMTAIGTGLADQQISNDPGGDRWRRLIGEATEMFFNHVSNRTTDRTKGRTRT